MSVVCRRFGTAHRTWFALYRGSWCPKGGPPSSSGAAAHRPPWEGAVWRAVDWASTPFDRQKQPRDFPLHGHSPPPLALAGFASKLFSLEVHHWSDPPFLSYWAGLLSRRGDVVNFLVSFAFPLLLTIFFIPSLLSSLPFDLSLPISLLTITSFSFPFPPLPSFSLSSPRIFSAPSLLSTVSLLSFYSFSPFFLSLFLTFPSPLPRSLFFFSFNLTFPSLLSFIPYSSYFLSYLLSWPAVAHGTPSAYLRGALRRSQQRGLLPTDHNLTYGCYGQRPPLKVNELGGLQQPKKEKKALPRATAGVGERVRLLPSTHTGLRTTGSKEIQRGAAARRALSFALFSLPKALPEAVAVEANRQTPRPTRPQQAGREGEILFHAGEVVVHTVTVRGSPSPQAGETGEVGKRVVVAAAASPRGEGESPLTEGEREEGRRDRDGSSGRISRRRHGQTATRTTKHSFPRTDKLLREEARGRGVPGGVTGPSRGLGPHPDLGLPRRRDRQGSKTRVPGDPRTGALENDQPARRVEQGAERAAGSYQDPGLRRPSSQRVAATYCGGKIARRRRAGGGRRSPLGSFGTRPPEREVATRPLPSPAGRRTESPQFDLRISARLAS
ncbi:hypothetical protein C7M84_018114 [Penaeus vannamei]|uniref:Uncharacterized protein n=1 Tax=Penaeus vannamei TaxID=6689 RepID=A0A423SIC4_PENVA|nr:hypothetical protein C7M84_018114 [Penaeus vannamei]